MYIDWASFNKKLFRQIITNNSVIYKANMTQLYTVYV